MHQQRGLARRRGALERCGGHGDDDTTALEAREHVTTRERSRLRVEVVATFEEPGRRARVEIRAEGHDDDVCVERSGLRLDALGRGIDRRDVGLHELHTRFHDVRVVVMDTGRGRAAEHYLELREAEHERVGAVDEHHVDTVTELV